jgi:hypothetical protein
VLLAAFRDVVASLDEPRLAEDLRMLTENSGVMASETERHKVWPTNQDRKVFEAVMGAGSPAALAERFPPVRPKYHRQPLSRPRLVEAYLFFHVAILSYANEVDGPGRSERVHALYEAVRRHLQVVVIELEESDDPQLIFETLNARGEPLLPSDLVKNFLFTRAVRDNLDIERLYDDWWREYDERQAEDSNAAETAFWKRRERQGRMLRTRLDLFLFHYLTYRTRDDMSIGHLFDAFRDWWREDAERSVEGVLQDMRAHSDAFAGLFVPVGASRLSVFARRLQRLDTSTVYPLLLLLMVGGRGRLAHGALDGIIDDLESYLVRRTLCRMTTKNYNRFFLKVLEDLETTPQIDRPTFQRILLEASGPSGEWPDDARFERAWLNEPVYGLITAPKLVMMLHAIERSLCGARQESVAVSVEGLTIEHVMPQSWAQSWPVPAVEAEGESAEERRNRLLDTFGNLTLLTSTLNASVSNGPYAEKRAEITSNSQLMLNKWFQERHEWDEERILERGRALFELARRIWPHPTSKAEEA